MVKTKGRRTQKHIIEKTTQVFSVKGYFNTSVNDLEAATGLTKGGIYVHFKTKEAIWWACYEAAAKIWKDIVFKDVKKIEDPLERILKTIDNHLNNYVKANVFNGGCFFLNMLVELSGQSESMSSKVLEGFTKFTNLYINWLKEAETKGLIPPKLNHREIANFIVTALNGASALYAGTKNAIAINQTAKQLHSYVDSLRK